MTLDPGLEDLLRRETPQVLGALVRRFGQEAENIAVSVEGPCVTLRGSAPTLRIAREARAAAWSAPGVQDVVDAIETGAAT